MPAFGPPAAPGSVVLLPDTEQLVSGFLRDQAEVEVLVADRVYTVMPGVKGWPLVRLTRFAGTPVYSHPLWLDVAVIQVDAYASRKKDAWSVAETCRAVMADRLVGSHDEGVISKVQFGALGYRGVEQFTPDQHKYDFLVTVWCHPLTDVYVGS